MNDSATPLSNPEENPKERLDRELMELLQGLRVAATGVQVLFAFLLTLPFSAGFGKIGREGHWLFLIAVITAALASICLIAPATQHRILYRSGLKAQLLRRANRLGVVGGIALAISMVCSTSLVVDVLTSLWLAVVIAAAIAALSAWLWFVQPLVSLLRARRHDDDQ
ncbi:DUF6328 family protein [Planotetraspora kaengkrachanensis]|uniref:Uncharacterized protein n=1 Tax=Planotetraspora kaengkrachanensis TaxID=575193 RepID=A0A8J3V8F4_9ACTN|nr:DUF6328 family protein [Planotetraspora kaengkrachanensis]GIG82122.1 hypothetical protein Pka01_52490 [Planotetraspora kaengkrachanensis]